MLLPLFAVSLSTFANFRQVIRGKKGIFIKAGGDRFNEPVKLGANLSICKVSAVGTDGDIAVFESIGNVKVYLQTYPQPWPSEILLQIIRIQLLYI